MHQEVLKNWDSGACPDELTLQMYVDGESEAAAAELIFHHLTQCPACAARLQEKRAARMFWLERLGEDDERNLAANTAVLQKVREALRQETQAKSPAAQARCFWQQKWSTWRRPLWLAATATVILLGLFGLQRWRGNDTALAAELLRRSAEAETLTTADPQQVIHRTINFTASMPGRDTRHTVTRRIEIWKAADQVVRRVYDESGALLGGRWQTAANTRRFRNPQIKFQMLLPLLPNGIPRLEQLLDKEFTAQNFRTLIGNATEARVESTSDVYVINYSNEAVGLVRATLTLRRSDLHPIAQTLVTRCRESLCETSFAETGFARLEAVSVAPGVLLPDTTLEEIPLRSQETRTQGKAQ